MQESNRLDYKLLFLYVELYPSNPHYVSVLIIHHYLYPYFVDIVLPLAYMESKSL